MGDSSRSSFLKMVGKYARDYLDYHREHPISMAGSLDEFQIRAITSQVNIIRKARKKAGISNDLRLLDYGCGKGAQYLSARIHEAWGGELPYCYDPGVPYLARRPRGTFDGIICTDVLEHIDEDDLERVVADIYSYVNLDAPSFIYLYVCNRPASKEFPDGRNLHLTVRPPEWWDNVLYPPPDSQAFGGMYENVRVFVQYDRDIPVAQNDR